MIRSTRRNLLRLGAAVATSKVMAPTIVSAQSKNLVVCSPGGTYTAAQRKAIYEPFEKEFAVKIIEAGPTDYGKLKAMVMSKNVEWDLFDGTDRKFYAGVAEDLFEPLDFQLIDVKDVIPEAVHKYGVGVILSSTVLGYNTKKYTDATRPKSWADFWDIKKFPGKRMMQKSPDDNLAFALLADGVPMDKLYPLDLDRAFKVMNKIKNEVGVWWTTGAQSEQAFVNGECDMGAIWNGRVDFIAKQGQPVALDWNQGQLHVDLWSIPKGAKNAKLAQQYIAFATQPKIQAAMAKELPYGPVNRKAYEFIDPKVAATLASSPENIKNQFLSNGEYWAKYYDKVNDAWQAWIVS